MEVAMLRMFRTVRQLERAQDGPALPQAQDDQPLVDVEAERLSEKALWLREKTPATEWRAVEEAWMREPMARLLRCPVAAAVSRRDYAWSETDEVHVIMPEEHGWSGRQGQAYSPDVEARLRALRQIAATMTADNARRREDILLEGEIRLSVQRLSKAG